MAANSCTNISRMAYRRLIPMIQRSGCFDGHPAVSRAPLQVAVSSPCWATAGRRQTGSSFTDCPALDPDGLETHADDDGIVCLTALKGEPPAEQRLNALLADAFGADWSAAKLASLLAEVGFAGKTLDDWLRDGFFAAALRALPSASLHLAHLGRSARRLPRAGQLPPPRRAERRRPAHAGEADLLLSRRLDRPSARRPEGRRRRRGRAPRRSRAPEDRADQDPRRRAALRHLRPLEAAARTADRLGARHQRRRADEHPPLHDRAPARTRAARMPASCARRRRSSGTRIAARSRPATRPTIPGSGAGTKRRQDFAGGAGLRRQSLERPPLQPRRQSRPRAIATARRREAKT